MGKDLISLIALETVLATYSVCFLVTWNWLVPNKPVSFWVAFCLVHVIRFVGQQFRK